MSTVKLLSLKRSQKIRVVWLSIHDVLIIVHITTAADTLPAHLKMSSRLLTRFVYFTLSVTFVMYFNGRNKEFIIIIVIIIIIIIKMA